METRFYHCTRFQSPSQGQQELASCEQTRECPRPQAAPRAPFSWHCLDTASSAPSLPAVSGASYHASPLSSVFMLRESILEFSQGTFHHHTETGLSTPEAQQRPMPQLGWLQAGSWHRGASFPSAQTPPWSVLGPCGPRKLISGNLHLEWCPKSTGSRGDLVYVLDPLSASMSPCTTQRVVTELEEKFTEAHFNTGLDILAKQNPCSALWLSADPPLPTPL